MRLLILRFKKLDLLMKLLLPFLLVLPYACSHRQSNNSTADHEIRQRILSLEQKWIEAEFELDTAYISNLLDTTFIGITAAQIANKQQEINSVYANMKAMRTDSIFLDSLVLEDAVVNVYGNMVVTSFISHTFKKDKGRSTEKRMRFYDVWIQRDGEWKALSSQGTVIP